MPFYYYADAYTDPDGIQTPGKDTGGGLENGRADIPPGVRALKLDKTRSPSRFVLRLHDAYNTPAPGWVLKTQGEVEADYPGLVGGG